jgi:hypothetical protein
MVAKEKPKTPIAQCGSWSRIFNETPDAVQAINSTANHRTVIFG